MTATVRQGSVSPADLYHHRHYEALLGMCLKMQGRLQWQELHLCSLSLIQLGHASEAIVLLEQLLSLAPPPMQGQIRLQLCYCFSATKQWERALFILKSLEDFPKLRSLTARLTGHINWRMGKHDEAIKILEQEMKNVKKVPANLLNILGYMLVDSGTDIERGYDYCHQAIQIVPNYAPYLDSFGWACFKKGELDRARYFLQHAQLLLPQSHEIKEHLTVVEGK